jgi:hypothetical protein
MAVTLSRRSSAEQLNHVKQLLAKHLKSKDKLEQQRLRLEEERLKQLKSRPEIRRESRVIAEKAFQRKLKEQAEAEYTASRHRRVNSLTFSLETVKDLRPVSPEQFSAARNTSDLLHTFVNRSLDMEPVYTCKVNVSTGEGSSLKLPRNAAASEMYSRVADLRNIRQLLAQSYNFEPIEPPDPLEMEFMDRGRQWVRQKAHRLMERVGAVKASELDGCTFKPKISRWKSCSPSRHSTDSTVPTPKYADIHSPKNSSFKQSSMKRSLLESTIRSSAPDLAKPLKSESVKQVSKLQSVALSPVSLKLAYPYGFDYNRLYKAPSSVKKPVRLRIK